MRYSPPLCSQYPIKESWMNRELLLVGWGFGAKPPGLSLEPSFLICNLRALTLCLWWFPEAVVVFSYFLTQGRSRLLESEGDGLHSRPYNFKSSLNCRGPCLRISCGELFLGFQCCLPVQGSVRIKFTALCIPKALFSMGPVLSEWLLCSAMVAVSGLYSACWQASVSL